MCYISSANPNNFFIHRLIRIVPPYWVATLGVYFIARIAPTFLKSTTARTDFLLKSLFFIPYTRESGGTFPVLFLGWTLEYEIFFYMLFALALIVTTRWASLLTVGQLVTVAVLGLLMRPHSVLFHFFSRPIILEFAFGVVAFWIWTRKIQIINALPVFLGIMGVFICYILLVVTDREAPGHFSSHLPAFLLLGIPAFALLLFSLSLENKVKFPIWLLSLGDASFSLYLLHPYIIQLVNMKFISFGYATPTSIIALILTIGICFLVATLSYRVFERPLNDFLKKSLLRTAGRQVFDSR